MEFQIQFDRVVLGAFADSIRRPVLTMGPSASFACVNDDVFVCGFSSSSVRCDTAATRGLRILILGCLPGNSVPIAPSLLIS